MHNSIRSYIKRPRAATAGGPWKTAALCAAYQWPTSAPGGGVIGILEMGGGWVASDIAAFCSANSIPVPNVVDVSVDGTKNTPGNDADVEVALDIEVAAASYAVATGGKQATIRVYWTQDIAAALAKATADGCAVFSMSWGASESQWSASDMQAMQAAAAAACAAGCVPFGAAGDNDADDNDGDGQPSVDCPASCPSVIGCGGTMRPQSGTETVWNDSAATDAAGEGTGGGFSAVFPVQAFQVGAPKPPAGLGRMVPDVAANADPNTGYEIYVGGSATTVGGTSAVAPLYAGLFAAFGPKLPTNVRETLWANQGAFTDVTQGTNGLYAAAAGPDACTGIGVPVGSKIDGLFAAAPVPQPSPPPAPVPVPTAPPTEAQLVAALTQALSQGFQLVPREVAVQEAVAAVQALFPPAAS